MIYLQLFFEFFKTGLFSIGGGLATLPFLYEMSNKTHWFSHADIADMIAISESTPGAIGINMSTFAGFKTAGYPGGVVATVALATPSLIIIIPGEPARTERSLRSAPCLHRHDHSGRLERGQGCAGEHRSLSDVT